MCVITNGLLMVSLVTAKLKPTPPIWHERKCLLHGKEIQTLVFLGNTI